MKTNKWIYARALVRPAAVLVATVVVLAGLSAVSAAEGRPAGPNAEKQTKAAPSPAVEQAALAARLALQGEKTRSPILLLAAAEILGNLRESPRDVDDVKAQFKGSGAESDKKETGDLSVRRLVQLARECAKDDPELTKFIESRLKNLSSRGIIYSQGKDKPSMKLMGTTFKVVKAGVLRSGYTYTASNVIFEGRKPAVVAVVGDGDGDLDLAVYDDDGGGLIDEDDDITSQCIVQWTPRWEGPFRIKVSNVGDIAERFVVLVNW